MDLWLLFLRCGCVCKNGVYTQFFHFNMENYDNPRDTYFQIHVLDVQYVKRMGVSEQYGLIKTLGLGVAVSLYLTMSCNYSIHINIYIYTKYIFIGVMSQLMEAITMTVSGFKPNCISQIPWRSHPKSDQTGPDLDVHPVLPSDFRARFPACMCVCACGYRIQRPVASGKHMRHVWKYWP